MNAAIDPYWLVGSKEVQGLNKEKPEFWRQLLAGKPALVRRVRPKAVILGTSRAMLGLDPQHECWQTGPVFNLGLEGPNFYQIRRYFEHAVSVSNIERAVLTLDFFSFNVFYLRQTDYIDQRLARNKKEWVARFPYVPDLARALISIDSLKASFITLKGQAQEGVIRKDGLRVRGWLKPVTGTEQFNMQYVFARQFDRMVELTWLPAPANLFSLTNSNGASPLLADLDALITLAHQRNIDLHLVISPVHAQVLEVFRYIGIDNLYLEWIQQVLKINEQSAIRLNRAAFPLWDFSGYNSITTEIVPGPGEVPASMKWYTEASHYNQATGNLVLDKVLNCRNGAPVPDDFGSLIDSQNIDQHFRRFTADGLSYRASHVLHANPDKWQIGAGQGEIDTMGRK